MLLKPITDSGRAKAAFDQLARELGRDAVKHENSVGYQGGGGKYDVHWRPNEGFWCLLEPLVEKGRYWCCFGTQNPVQTTGLTIACEINPPHEGVNRLCAGAFLEDDSGQVFLAHSGRVGGGRRGISKQAFLAQYAGRSRLKEVAWPDGKQTEMIVIARLGEDRLATDIADFVFAVEKFKQTAVGSKKASPANSDAEAAPVVTPVPRRPGSPSPPWDIHGQPVPWAAGETELQWRATLKSGLPDAAEAARLGSKRTLQLAFMVGSHQVLGMPDLDNLLVPVVEELRNAGWFSRGYPELDALVIDKRYVAGEMGVRIELRPHAAETIGSTPVTVPTKIRQSDAKSALAVEDAVRSYLGENEIDPLPLGVPVELTLVYEQVRPTSLISMLKTSIDGLEPLLQRAPNAIPRHRFYPADERVVRVVAIRRKANEDALKIGWKLGDA